MKIAVFGGSGMLGKLIIEEALKKGIEVKVLARTPAKLGDLANKVEIVTGDYFNPSNQEETLQGVDMVVSTIGPPPRSKNFTVADYTKAMNSLIAAMNKQGITRIINVAGAGTSYPGEPIVFGRHILRFFLKIIGPMLTPVKEAELHALMQSSLDFTTVRPPVMTPSIKGEFAISEDQYLGAKANARDLAKFMIDALDKPEWHRKMPFIGVR